MNWQKTLSDEEIARRQAVWLMAQQAKMVSAWMVSEEIIPRLSSLMIDEGSLANRRWQAWIEEKRRWLETPV